MSINSGQEGTGRSLRVLVCYAPTERQAVQGLCERLRAEGVELWLSQKDLLPGQDWDEQIKKTIRQSDAAVVCLSYNSMTSEGYIHREIRAVLERHEEMPEDTFFLIPVKLERCELPQKLSHLQCTELYEEGGYERVRAALQVRAVKLGRVIRPLEEQVAPVLKELQQAQGHEDWARVVELGEKALAIDEKNQSARAKMVGAYNRLAQIYLELGEFEEAVRYCNRTLKLEPENAGAKETRAAADKGWQGEEERQDEDLQRIARKIQEVGKDKARQQEGQALWDKLVEVGKAMELEPGEGRV